MASICHINRWWGEEHKTTNPKTSTVDSQEIRSFPLGSPKWLCHFYEQYHLGLNNSFTHTQKKKHFKSSTWILLKEAVIQWWRWKVYCCSFDWTSRVPVSPPVGKYVNYRRGTPTWTVQYSTDDDTTLKKSSLSDAVKRGPQAHTFPYFTQLYTTTPRHKLAKVIIPFYEPFKTKKDIWKNTIWTWPSFSKSEQ